MGNIDPKSIIGLKEMIEDLVAQQIKAASYNDSTGVIDLGATLIEDEITNGTTDKAPSSNAVYDALALKQDAASSAVAATVITAAEQSAPASPAAGFHKLYVKSDGKLYIKNSAGTETVVGSQS